MNPMTFKNCTIQNAGSEPMENMTITVQNGKIVSISGESCSDADTADVSGLTAVPGFIDVHVQGAGGMDVLDSAKEKNIDREYEALSVLSKTQLKYGVTSYLATTVFRAGQDNTHLQAVSDYMESGRKDGALCLGTHLEGPFISNVKKGMIRPDCICPPSKEMFSEILNLTDTSLKMMTIAPEIDGSDEIVQMCRENGIIPSFGHSEATYEKTRNALVQGVSHATHLFNAMMPVHHREPGPLLALAEDDECTVQLISDGVHIHRALIPHVYRIFGCRRIVLITDGMQAMGLPEGMYVYNGLEYESSGGTARYHDGTLIGTTLGLSDILKRFMEFTGCSLAEALYSVTEVPAQILGIADKKGKIAPGMDADIIFINNDLEVKAGIVGGEVLFDSIFGKGTGVEI